MVSISRIEHDIQLLASSPRTSSNTRTPPIGLFTSSRKSDCEPNNRSSIFPSSRPAKRHQHHRRVEPRQQQFNAYSHRRSLRHRSGITGCRRQCERCGRNAGVCKGVGRFGQREEGDVRRVRRRGDAATDGRASWLDRLCRRTAGRISTFSFHYLRIDRIQLIDDQAATARPISNPLSKSLQCTQAPEF